MKQVQIAKVNGSTCIDATGKELIRIGNMNVRAGDVVWTDGRCIYGNMMHNTEPEISFANSSDMKAPGIPLYCSNGNLLIYTKNHKIYRYSPVTDYRSFVNNDKFCGFGDTRSADVDIGSAKDLWEIDIFNSGYSATSAESYFEIMGGYNQNNIKDMSGELRGAQGTIAELWHKKGRKSFWWEPDNDDRIFIKSVRQVYSGCNVDYNSPFKIIKNGQIKNYYLGEYAGIALSGVQSQFEGGAYQDMVTGYDSGIANVHIDENGNWWAIIIATAGGLTFDGEGKMKRCQSYYAWLVHNNSKKMIYRAAYGGETFIMENYYLPIQDNFTIKCEGVFVDGYTLYKNTNKLFRCPGWINGAWELNPNEYLILCNTTVYIYRNSVFTQVKWNGQNISVMNRRLRYMSQLQNLKNAYAK